MKSVSGQLRTHLNLSIQETTTFAELRDHVLRWDRSQQRWNGLLFSDEATSSTAAPMEVDRIYSSGKKGGKTKAKGGNRKVNRRARGNQRQSPKVMEGQTARASRRETERANQVGSPMIPLDTRAKAIVQVECAIDVASQGTMHVTVGRPMSELCSQRVNNYRILRLHNHCSHLQAQLQWEPQVQALSNSHQLSFELQEFMNLSFKVLQMLGFCLQIPLFL